MTDSKKPIQQISSSDFEQNYLNDVKYKGYAESLRSDIALIVYNYDSKLKVLTKEDIIIMLRNCVKLSEQMYNAFDNLCEDKYRLVNEVSELNGRMRNMEEMIFEKDNEGTLSGDDR